MVAQRSTRSPRPDPAPSPARITEKAWMATVIELATRLKWLVYHPYDSRRSTPGFPDLTLARNGRLLFIELKTARGKVSPDQQFWLDTLAKCDGVEMAEVWRPNQFEEIVEVLR